MKNCKPPTLTEHLNKSSILAFLFIISACSAVDIKPETSSSKPTTPGTVSTNSSTVSANSSAPRLSVASNENDIIKIMSALLSNEKNPLTPKNVGYYMDVLYANLQQKLNGNIATISRHENGIHIIFPGSLAFATNRASINTKASHALSLIVGVLSEYSKTVIEVGGHTDSQGDPGYNQQLSEKRALAVGQYLTENKVAINRLLIKGFGATKPVSGNETAEDRAQNRRVELILTPVVLKYPSSN